MVLIAPAEPTTAQPHARTLILGDLACRGDESRLCCDLVPGQKIIVVPHQDLLPAAFDLAGRILRHSGLVASGIITAVTRGLNGSIDEGLAIEREQFARLVPTRDTREALDAWLARRTPDR